VLQDFLHINKMVWSKQLFSYLDRFYTPKRKLPTTLLVGYQTFRRIIFSGETSDVKDSLLGLIHDDREGSIVDRPQIKNVIQIFIDCGLRQTSSPGVRNDSVVQPQVELTLDVYKQDFEQDFMSATTEYYMNKSRTWVEQDTFPDYLLKAEQIYNDEEKRRRDFLHESSERALLQIVDTVLVGEYQEALLANRDTGLRTLLTRYDATNGRRTEDLERVYRMFKRLEENEHSGVLPVARMCEQHFLKIGTQIITENSRCLSLDANGVCSQCCVAECVCLQ
jgi:cullin 1